MKLISAVRPFVQHTLISPLSHIYKHGKMGKNGNHYPALRWFLFASSRPCAPPAHSTAWLMSVWFRASALSVINPPNTNTSVHSQPDADPLPSGKCRSALMPLVSRAHGRSTTTASKSISWEREMRPGETLLPTTAFLPLKRCNLKWTAERSTLKPAPAASILHFPSSLAWIGVYLFGVASRKVVCGVWVEIRVVLVRMRGFSAALKRSISFLGSYVFHRAQIEGQFCSGGLQDAVVSAPALTQEERYVRGKVPEEDQHKTNIHKSETDTDERQSLQIASARRQRIIDRSRHQTVLSKKPFGFSESTARQMNR